MSDPEVPVIVTVEVPTVAVVLAVKVTTLVDVVGLVPKLAVTPAGKPEADRVTEPVKPLVGVSVMVLVPLVPCLTLKLAGDAESEKFGVAVALTVSETVVVCVNDPDVPVMVTVDVPVVAVALAVKVNTLVPVVGLVPNDAVTPEGRPEADSVTEPVKPPEGVSLMVVLPLLPWVTVKLAGDAESEKLGLAAAGGKMQLFAALENSN